MIVVGVDGSRAGLAAAIWAAREAVLREGPLLVAHAMVGWACETYEGRYADVARWLREGANTVLSAGVERAQREEPKLTVESALLPGDPRAALIEQSGGADLLVVGNHGLGAVRGLLVGSVAYGVAAYAACDVVVVRETPSRPRNEIVVGLDGSARGTRVLEFAFAEAALRGAQLRAVHAWKPLRTDEEQDELHLLREELAGWCERFPDVPVVNDVVQGHPVEVLEQAATGADLLVIGSHGHGELVGLVLGSVSQAMLHRAPCPLAVVRNEGMES